MGHEGYVDIGKKRIRIRSVQLEEDPAKIIREDEYSLLDFNRSGIPLNEIVTEPDIETEEELEGVRERTQEHTVLCREWT